MNRLIAPLVASVCLSGAAVTLAAGADTTPLLSPADVAAGWTVLFDGSSTDHWRGYRQQTFPAQGWVIEDGTLHVKAGSGAGDIISIDQYADFELIAEFRCAPKANSGIMYHVTEANDTTWQTGPEFQVLDDAGEKIAPDDKHSAGALYDMIAPPRNKVDHPAGEWNEARIRVQHGVLQHWLNGVKTVECRIDDQSWKDMIAASKFKGYNGFGIQPKGHIALQEHGDDVWYRNIRVRDLDAPLPGQVSLFNGKDLSGWEPVLNDHGKPEDVWSVEDGVLICKGNPVGYIRTTADYTNYVLKLEWRFNPVTKKAGNSGVLLRMVGEDKVWPRSIEAQLESGNAGDFWNIDKFVMTVDPARTNGRNTRKTHGAERPIGEWNEYEIIVDHSNVTLKVNGEVLNTATQVEEVPGKICLQSEGAEIQFRDIRLSPIK